MCCHIYYLLESSDLLLRSPPLPLLDLLLFTSTHISCCLSPPPPQNKGPPHHTPVSLHPLSRPLSSPPWLCPRVLAVSLWGSKLKASHSCKDKPAGSGSVVSMVFVQKRHNGVLKWDVSKSTVVFTQVKSRGTLAKYLSGWKVKLICAHMPRHK